jgi:hypothetical protein
MRRIMLDCLFGSLSNIGLRRLVLFLKRLDIQRRIDRGCFLSRRRKSQCKFSWDLFFLLLKYSDGFIKIFLNLAFRIQF